MAQNLNQNLLAGKWSEIKGDLQRLWGRLTDDELESAKGSVSEFAGTVQRKYGIAQDEACRQIDEVFNKYRKNYDETKHKH